MEITVLIRIKHLSRKRPFLVKVPFSRFPFTFSPNPGRWLLCVAEFPGIPSCYLYEIVKVQVRAFSFWRINPSPIKLGRGYLPTCISCFFIFFILRVGKQAFQSLISRGISFLEQVSLCSTITRFAVIGYQQLDGDFVSPYPRRI